MTEPVVTPDAPQDGESHSSNSPRLQLLIGIGALLVAAVLAVGAARTSSEAGYGGVGPNFLPWVVSLALLACGVFLIRESRSGGYREMEEGSGAGRGHWAGFAWVSAGLLLNAWLITTLGFILSCALCFVFAVRGFKSAEGRLDLSPRAWIVDLLIGFVIAAPVYWMFTQLLAINLPGLTETGWL
jgi:putative tricarboxylic transport membrane protein